MRALWICHKHLILRTMNNSGKLSCLFIYKMTYAKIKAKGGLTDPIKIMKGVLQGETASPSIFNYL